MDVMHKPSIGDKVLRFPMNGRNYDSMLVDSGVILRLTGPTLFVVAWTRKGKNPCTMREEIILNREARWMPLSKFWEVVNA